MMADLDRVKRNISRMISMNAPEADIDAYINSEGVTLDQVRAHKIGSATEQPDTLTDVAKSAGIGAAQGVMGLATLPGNIEALGRAGINYGAKALGYKDNVVDPDSYIPNYNDAKQFVEGYTGKFYEPKTTAGEYARTVGEFLPGGLGGGSLASRAARVAVPALMSETAGQITEGTPYEPFARAGGAIVGGMSTPLMSRVATPAPASAERARQVANLEGQGVTALTAGQRTGSGRIRSLEDASNLIPFGGGRAGALQDQARRQFNQAALRQAGINADEATGPVLNQAFADLGREYQALGQAINVRPDRAFINRLQGIVNRYIADTPATDRVPRIAGLLDDLRGRQSLAGSQFTTYISELKRAERGLKNNPVAQRSLRDIITTLEAQAIRSAPQQVRGQLRNQMRDLNRRYRNMAIIEDAVTRGAGESAAQGMITPASLKAAIKKRSPREYSRERTPLAELAKAGEGVLRPLSSSGTAERNLAVGMLNPFTGGAGGLGVATASGAMDPVTGFLMGAVTPMMLSRALMSRPGQAYLGNQAVTGTLPPNYMASALAPYLLNKDDQNAP